eukprot:scaffold1257_cov140-Skeletonema_menzelii.AAC.7
MKTRNNNKRVAAATAQRLFWSSAAGTFVCFCSDTSSSVLAFQTTTFSLSSSSGLPLHSERKLASTKVQSRENKSRLLVTNDYYHEEEQQYQINEGEGTYFEHQYSWDNDDNDDTSSWYPMTDSLLEDFINSRQMEIEELEANGQEVVPTSTEILLDSLKPKPIDTVTSQDIEEQFLRMVSNEVEYKRLLGQSPYALTDIKFPVLLQRFLDNIEDSSQKNNGKIKGQSKLRGRDQPRDERKTVVVLGTGWASHAFIKLASTYDLRIVVVSPVNHFVFT